MNNTPIFVIFSTIYVFLLAIVDGLFNRLVFRSKRTLAYKSEYKKEIYKMWEWGGIGFTFLILLTIVLPVLGSYCLGGIAYVLVYLIILMLIPWDMIFGILVFDDIFGDTPSIAIPFYGWISIPLWLAETIRIILAIIMFIKLKTI